MAERGRAPGRAQGVAGTWPPHGGVHTGGFTAGFGVWPGALEKLREWVRAEAGAGRLLPWVPIAFGTGIAFYFAADHEPVLPVAVVTALGLGVVAFLLRRGKFFTVAVMAASVAAGFATATFRTAHIAHEVLVKPAYSVSLSGFCRGAGHSRTDRPFRIARDADGRPATTGKT
jgi:competence protein ComEC